MVIQLNSDPLSSMSFDHLSLPSSRHRKPPDIDIMNSPATTNSLKHRTSPQIGYKYSKNKHLSQQIHKKKKNRNKQTHHKKKKLIKMHKHNANKNIHKKKLSKHQKKPKLKKSKSLTPLHQTDNDIDDLYDAHYIKKHNEMTQKHKKIQVINNSDQPYYLQTTSVSSNTLHNYNYKLKNNLNNLKKAKIIWVQSPSPMLLPGSNLSCATTKCASPFLLSAVPCKNHLKPPAIPSLSPYHSPVLTQRGGDKGEMLMGFESGDANIIFRSLAEMNDMSPQRSQMSDYKYEGLQSHNNNNTDRMNDDITYCLNILKSINNINAKDSCHLGTISIEKLTEIGTIVEQLKNKIVSCTCEEEEDEKTDSAYVRTCHLSLNTNTSDEEQEHEDEDEDEEDSNQSIISGVKLMEDTTPNESQDGLL